MKMNKIFTKAFVALAAIAGFTACSSDDYEMATKPNNAQVFFSNESATELLLEENQNQVEVEVKRLKTEGALTVEVAATDESGLFTAANSVTFADGEDTAKLPISFNFTKLESDKAYPVTLTLKSETCAYGDNTVTVNIKYAPWSEWKPLVKGYSTFTFTYYYAGTDDRQRVYIRTSMLDPTQAQLKLANWTGDGEKQEGGYDLIFNWNKKLNLLTLSPVAFDKHDTYGTVYVADTYTYVTKVLQKEGDLEKQRSYYDEENGCFMLNLVYFVQAGNFGNGYETLQLPGYEKADYSLNIADNGSYQQDLKIGQVFNMTMGKDLTSIKYAVFKGAIVDDKAIDEKAQAIFTGDIASTQTKENGWRVVMVDEAGDYTLVALGYDANGTWQGTQSVAFTVKSPIGKTWRKSFTGDYTYGEVAYEGVDKGLTLYTCDEDASVFTIAPWAGGGSLKFQLDEDGKTVHVFNSYTGEDYKEGAPIYAGDANALLGDEYEASYYDAATKTYHFNVVYFVPGLGLMGACEETFVVSGPVAKTIAKATAKAKVVSNRTISAAPRAKMNKSVKALKLMK